MKCPKCSDVTLLMTEKQNVDIDYCPECRGIWIDREKLEKIIERSTVPSIEERSSYRKEKFEYDDDNHYRDYDDDDHGNYGKKGGYRKQSFFKNLLDF